MFEKELAYFIAHQDELVKHGKVLVIRDEHVEGMYETPREAYLSASEPGTDAHTATIDSRPEPERGRVSAELVKALRLAPAGRDYVFVETGSSV